MYESIVSDVVNEQAALKVKTKSVPCMNEQLRKSMNVNIMFRRKHYRVPNIKKWEA